MLRKDRAKSPEPIPLKVWQYAPQDVQFRPREADSVWVRVRRDTRNPPLVLHGRIGRMPGALRRSAVSEI